MNLNIDIETLKLQLHIESGYTQDDIILQHYLDVAELAVENYLGVNALTGYTGTTGTTATPISIQHAVIILAAHYYLNRNMVSFGQGYEIPYSFRFLLDPYKDWIVI